MKRAEVCERIKELGIVPAIRVCSAEDAHFAADSIAKGGIPIVEITMTVPEAVELISIEPIAPRMKAAFEGAARSHARVADAHVADLFRLRP